MKCEEGHCNSSNPEEQEKNDKKAQSKYMEIYGSNNKDKQCANTTHEYSESSIERVKESIMKSSS